MELEKRQYRTWEFWLAAIYGSRKKNGGHSCEECKYHVGLQGAKYCNHPYLVKAFKVQGKPFAQGCAHGFTPISGNEEPTKSKQPENQEPQKTQGDVWAGTAYLSQGEAAQYLNITIKHLIDMQNKGLIKATKLGPHCVRYRIADLDALMARFRV